LDKKAHSELAKLPGPYTLIIKLKNKDVIAKNINPKNDGTLGIRVPDHWFHNLVEAINFPIITTSANRSGQPFMTSLENLDPEIEKGVDFIIYEGEKQARPSQIIDLVKGTVKER
jgi:L-threonylcarbamoyladenylate synthase